MEALHDCSLDFESLNKKYCYSFVLQHPANRIVIPIINSSIYLVAVYEIENNKLTNNKTIKIIKDYVVPKGVKRPQIYADFTCYNDLIDKYASMNTPYDIMGVIIHNTENGQRCKIRNPNYETVHHLRGIQPKLLYQYLAIRKQDRLNEYLLHFPQHKKMFLEFRDQLYLFTQTLYQNYIACYIKKEKQLKDYPPQFKTHMYHLHKKYINELLDIKSYINMNVVIQYMNDMEPSQIMFCAFRKSKQNQIKVVC